MTALSTQENIYNTQIPKLGQAVLGGIAALGQAASPGRGRYYVQANYKGNGLADTGLGYMANPDYRDPVSGAIALAQVFGGNKNSGMQNGSGNWGNTWNNIKSTATNAWNTGRNKLQGMYNNMTRNYVPGLPRGYTRINGADLPTSIPVRNGINSNVVDNLYQRGVMEQAILNNLGNINMNDPYYIGNIGRYVGG